MRSSFSISHHCCCRGLNVRRAKWLPRHSLRSSEEQCASAAVGMLNSRRTVMLGKADATPMIAVTDLDRARKFYEETLGLKNENESCDEGATLTSGETRIDAYRQEL